MIASGVGDIVSDVRVVGMLVTGPSGQIWDVRGKLSRNTRYGLVELGPAEKEKKDE